MKKSERRKHRRIAIKMPIRWRSVGKSKSNVSSGFLLDVKNITPSGLYLKTNLRPKKGSHIELVFMSNSHLQPISVKGKVIWIAAKKKHPYFYPGIGIKFIGLSGKERRKLNALIKHKLGNYRDAKKLKDMYAKLKSMASNLVELEERHLSASHFKKVINNAISEIDDVAHMLDREIDEVKNL
ncbi:MAG: PilZ domain-containing protein [Candidatus Omnitrophica bacterium]|nr:PilZ domain-containing protein [Candidatus Omnitrophota bacterium]